jgi:hypothetical protein
VTELASLAIISHTHWDREWYRTYQDYRLRLVDVVDALLDLLAARPEFASFLLDGQTVLLEDYLGIRPERADEIRRFVAAGRLQIGPWYVQPDEFLVSGEALIRNLALGKLSGAQLGGSCQAGWLPDTFGHIAQLPQILCNFDIGSLIFARGLGDQPVGPAGVFWLIAPSGHRVLAVHQFGGYTNGGNLGHGSFWGPVDPRTTSLSLAVEQVKQLLTILDPDNCAESLAIWNGADHTPAQSTLPEIITHLQNTFPDRDISHGTLQGYLDSLGHGAEARPVVYGELRGSRYQPLLGGVLSARMPLKLANARVERALLRYAEPLAALAWLAGATYPSVALWEAWRLVLQNQCHDSICGCHIDRVSEQMIERYRQAEELAGLLAGRAAQHLAAQGEAGGCEAASYPLLVANTLAQARHDVVSVCVRLPRFCPPYCVSDSRGTRGEVQIIAHRVRTYQWLAGNWTPAEFLAQAPMWNASLAEIDDLSIFTYAVDRQGDAIGLTLWLGDRRWRHEATEDILFAEIASWPRNARIHLKAYYHEVELAFSARSSGLGCEIHEIRSAAEPVQTDDPVRVGPGRLENRALRAEVDEDGLITLTHPATGRIYGSLGLLDDTADLGDTYDYAPLPDDSAHLRLVGVPRIDIIEAGPLQGALRVACTYEIPACLADERNARSTETVQLPVVSTLRLRTGSPILEIVIHLDNRGRDHRLRLHFPTGLQTETLLAGGHFGVVGREIPARLAEGWSQPPTNLQHHTHWFGVTDQIGGLAILSEGLPEHSPLPADAGVTLALTLLRCVGELSRADLSTRNGHAGPAIATPGAQCLGEHTFRCGVLPFARAELAGVSAIAEAFVAPPYVIPTSGGGAFPAACNPVLTLMPDFLVPSSLTVSEDGKRLAVRFYNPLRETVQATVLFGVPVRLVCRADAAENVLQPLEVAENPLGCRLEVGPAEIVTLLVTP